MSMTEAEQRSEFDLDEDDVRPAEGDVTGLDDLEDVPRQEVPPVQGRETRHPRKGRRRVEVAQAQQPPPPPREVSVTPQGNAATSEEWPKEYRALWEKILEWLPSQGRDPGHVAIQVERMAGVGHVGPPFEFDPSINGDQVAGSETESPGDALRSWIIDSYHMPVARGSARYRCSFYWRGTKRTGTIRRSLEFTLDSPEAIERVRRVSSQKVAQAASASQPSYYQPLPVHAPPMAPPYGAHTYGRPHQAPPSSSQAEAGGGGVIERERLVEDPFAGRYIDRLEAQVEEANRRLAEMGVERVGRRDDDMPPPPPPPYQAVPAEDPDARTARIVAQTVAATLQALGIGGAAQPPGAVAGAPPAAQPAVAPAVAQPAAPPTFDEILDRFCAEEEKRGKQRKLVARVLGMRDPKSEPEEEPEDDPVVTPTQVVVETKTTTPGGHAEIKVKKVPLAQWAGNPILIPQFDESDGEVGVVQQAVSFFASNPQMGRDIAMGLISKLGEQLTKGALGEVLAGLAKQAVSNPTGAAAQVVGSMMNGGAQSAGGFSPTT